MILQKPVPRCAECSHEWLPEKTAANPTGDPKLVRRCASCKTTRWNDDLAALESNKPGDKGPITPIATCRHRVLLSDCPLCRRAA